MPARKYDRRKTDQHNKEIIQEALSEWLDSKLSQFGLWSIYGIAAFLLAGITYMIFWSNGWRHTG